MKRKRDDILAYCAELLDVTNFSDYCVNGLQVEGDEEVGRIVTGVSASLALFEHALEVDADMVIAHHGLFWKKADLEVKGPMRRRLKLLLGNDINFAAYHLPLDAHPEVGNNAVLARKMGLEDVAPWDAEGHRPPIGMAGRFTSPKPAAEVLALLEEIFGSSCRSLPHGPDTVERVAVVTGGGSYALAHAIKQGIDMFVSGEAAEPSMALCAEAGVHYVAGGHYSSERFGIRALGEVIAREFGIPVSFVELPNPI